MIRRHRDSLWLEGVDEGASENAFGSDPWQVVKSVQGNPSKKPQAGGV